MEGGEKKDQFCYIYYMNEYYRKYYEEHKEELLLKQREKYYQKSGGVDSMTTYKVKKRLENQEKNYNFQMMKCHLEEWAAQEKTSVMQQCYKYCCLKEYFEYRLQHPEYDNSSDFINKLWDSVIFKN